MKDNEKIAELSATLYDQFADADLPACNAQAGQLEATIRKNLEMLGYG